jgi:hypothetical protein
MWRFLGAVPWLRRERSASVILIALTIVNHYVPASF